MKTLNEQKLRVVELLSEAYAHDFLSESELELRLEKAEHASTSGALAVLVEDLPQEIHAMLSVAAAAAPAPEQRLSSETLQVRITGGGLRRRGAWLTTSRVVVRCSMGSVKLDIPPEVLAAAPAIEVDVDVSHGRCVLFVPPGTIVQNEVSLEFSHFRLARRVRARPSDGVARGRLILRGTVRFGNMVVRRLRGTGR